MQVDETHDPALESWVESANDPNTDFPPQNLPFGTFRTAADRNWRPGVAIGDQIVDLWRAGYASGRVLRDLMNSLPGERAELRRSLSRGLQRGARDTERLQDALVAQSEAQVGLPCPIGDYTDFYVGIHHARAVGALFRPENPLLPNYRAMPIGYHGRASTIFASGHCFARPWGQVKEEGEHAASLAPTRRLDFELELGAFVGRGNDPGTRLTMDEAEDHLVGLVLLNDWSARDIQAWEYVPLGPFLGKNFATTISPWIVTMEAMAPFRRPYRRPAEDPAPLPYLSSSSNSRTGAIDIDLEVFLETPALRTTGQAPVRICSSSFAEAAYWTLSQMVAHHTVNGCSLRTGDLLGTGTLSGPAATQAGSLLERTQGGTRAVQIAPGETRTFLLDGDVVILRAHCVRPGFRALGFGECRAGVGPAPGSPL